MTESNQQQRDDRIERYARGELSPVEARDLAQESLDDPELFEELTYCALAGKAIAGGDVMEKSARATRLRGLLIGGSIAAAIAIVLSSYFLFLIPRPNPRNTRPSAALPTLAFSEDSSRPVLLASHLQTQSEAPQDVFRGAETAPREPRLAGVVTSIDDGMASIDLGSVDGLGKGIALEVYGDANDTQPAGRILVSTVLRERARGPFEGKVRERDGVRVPPAVHFNTRLEHVEALASRGNLEAARAAAEETVRWAASNTAADRRPAAWNTLAVLRILSGDRRGGEALMNEVLAASAGLPQVQILNNLGVLSELAGEKRRAAEHYRNALSALAAVPDAPPRQRQVLEANLARVN